MEFLVPVVQVVVLVQLQPFILENQTKPQTTLKKPNQVQIKFSVDGWENQFCLFYTGGINGMDCSEKQTQKWDYCFINQKEENTLSEIYVAQVNCILTYQKNQVALHHMPQMQTEQQKKKTYHRTHTE